MKIEDKIDTTLEKLRNRFPDIDYRLNYRYPENKLALVGFLHRGRDTFSIAQHIPDLTEDAIWDIGCLFFDKFEKFKCSR